MSNPDGEEAEIRYYREKAEDFTRKAMAASPGEFLFPFVERLKPSAPIFDVGCGCGRDLRWLRDLGFLPMGLERSPELAALARDYSGCEVILGDFKHYDLGTLRVDGLLFSGALVHLPPSDVADVLSRFLPCLSKDGKVYISLKKGCGLEQDAHGRRFYLWDEREAESLWQRLGLEICHFSIQTSEVGTKWLAWVLGTKKAIL